MRFHAVKMVGPYHCQTLAILPTYNPSTDEGRLVYLEDGTLWYGDGHLNKWNCISIEYYAVKPSFNLITDPNRIINVDENLWYGSTDSWIPLGGGGGGGASFIVTQSGHGFDVLDAIRYDSGLGLWIEAIANSHETLGSHVVVDILDSDNFVAAQSGRYEIPSHSLTPGDYHFVSPTIAGLLIDVEPPEYSNPLAYVEDSNFVHILPFRPSTPGGSSTIALKSFTGTGAQVEFDLESEIYANYVTIHIDGVYQNHDTFELDGDVLTFSEAPPAGTNIEVLLVVPYNMPTEDFIRRDGTVAFTDNQSMGNNRLTNIDNSIDIGDAINKGEFDDHTIQSHPDTDCTGGELETLTNNSDASSLHNHISKYLGLIGGTLTGNLILGTNKITGLGTGSDPADAANVGQLTSMVVGGHDIDDHDTTTTGLQLDELAGGGDTTLHYHSIYSRLEMMNNNTLVIEGSGYTGPQTDLVIYQQTFSNLSAPSWAKGPILRTKLKVNGQVGLNGTYYEADVLAELSVNTNIVNSVDISYISPVQSSTTPAATSSDTSWSESMVYVSSPSPTSTISVTLTSSQLQGYVSTWVRVDLVGWWG